MECCNFFKSNESNKEKCKLLQEISEQALNWEQSSSASEYSPGPVQDDETLHRQIFHPIHVDEETGKIKPALFEDASSKGLSVNRADFISDCDLIKKGLAKATQDQERKPDRKFLGFVSTECLRIRSIKSATGERAFCVFDTALINDYSHADVCQIVRGKQEGRSVRSKLYDAFNTLRKLS